jgi:putative salt-induced outer membrane protein YdiY
VKSISLLFLLTCFLATYSPLFAQIVEQPDPLRPSTPTSDSTKTKPPADSSKAATLVQSATKKDSTPPAQAHIFRYRFTADGTITSGNVNRTLLQLTSAVDYELSHLFKLSSNPSFVYGKQNELLSEREWFGDFRTTYRYEKRLYYLAFGSFERSNLRQINKRWTVAGGFGYKLLNHKKAYISITDVLMNENTDFFELSDIYIVRNSVRLFGEYTFDNDRFTVTHTVFYQPALGQYNIRWNASLSVQVKLTSATSLRTTLANAYESLVVPGRQNNDLRFTVGLVYERK